MTITALNYLNSKVEIIQIKGEDFFWVKMSDIEKGLGLKNIADTVRREIIGILNAKKRCDEDFKKYKRSLHEITNNITDNSKNKYIRNDIAEKIIKNCRGVKKCKNNTSRKGEEKQRQNFRWALGFKENDLFFYQRTISAK